MSFKAWIVQSPDGEFRAIDVVRKQLAPGEVLVRIVASGVNPLDTKIRAGAAAHAKQPLPAVLGLDMAGTVEEVAPGVTGFKPGDEVYGMVGGVGGLQGTLAEYVAADASLLAIKPANLTMHQAAALPLITITAWEGLIDHARVGAGQTVLIHAGAGGVGHIAVQIAVAYGAKVFATVSSTKAHIVEGYGATPVDYRTTTVEECVAQHAAGEGFDIVYDTVGGATIDASFVAAKRYTGHVLSCLGWSTHSLAPLSFRSATYSGVFTLYPLLSGNGRAHQGKTLAQAARLIEAGKLAPLMSEQRFTTDNIAAAYKLVESGSLGKVVVDI
jgi:NADPH:quinone reductase-like Zn-dependent oxidoreductase